MYYNFLQKWQKPVTMEMYRNINLSCLPLRSQLGSKVALRIFYYMNTPSFKEFHTKAVEGKV